MTIPKITPYTGGVANPDGSQTQTEFTQNMFDQLSYEANLSTELNSTVDGINDTAIQVDADATSASQSAAAAEAAVSGLDYQGLWPDTGGSANKGETWQTQTGGTPTGQYFTALQNTTADPVSDDVNWREVIGVDSVNSTSSQLCGGEIWPKGNNSSASNGDVIKSSVRFLRVSGVIYELGLNPGGEISNLNTSSLTLDIGGVGGYLSVTRIQASIPLLSSLGFYEPTYNGQVVTVSEQGKGGVFVYDNSDISTTDDTGIVVVTTNGARWKRAYSGTPQIEWFDFDLTGAQSASALLELILNRYGKLTGETDESDKLLIDSLVTVNRSVNWRFQDGITIDCQVKNARAMIVTGSSYLSKNVFWIGNRSTSEGLVTVCPRVKEYGGGYRDFYSNYDDNNQADTISRQVNECDYYRSNNQTWRDIKSDADGTAGSGGGTVRAVRFVNRILDAVFDSPTFDTIINETDAGGFIYDDADAIVGQVSSNETQNITVKNPTFIDCQKRCIKSQAGSGSHTKIIGGSCTYTLGSTSDVSVPESQANGMLAVVAIQGGKLTIKDGFEFKSGVIQTLFSVNDAIGACRGVYINRVDFSPTYSKFVATSRTKYFFMDLSSKSGVVVRLEHNDFGRCEIAAQLQGEDCYMEHNKFDGFSGDSAINVDVLANCFNVFNQYTGGNETAESGLQLIGCRYLKSFGNNFNKTRNGIVLSSSIDSMPTFEGVSMGDSFNSIFGDPIVNNMTTYKDNFVYWPGYTTKSFNSPITNIATSGSAGADSGVYIPIVCRGVQYKIGPLKLN